MNWDILVGIFFGFALGGVFHERMQERINRRRHAAKIAAERAKVEAFWRAHTK